MRGPTSANFGYLEADGENGNPVDCEAQNVVGAERNGGRVNSPKERCCTLEKRVTS